MSLSKTFVGFVQHKVAEGPFPNSLINYERHPKAATDFLKDPQVDKISAQELRGFFVWLRTDYELVRLTGGDAPPRSPKTRRNIWATLRSFFSWVSEEFGLPNPMDAVKAPDFQRTPVERFTKDEVESLLKACRFTREAITTDRRCHRGWRPTSRRDQAIILTVLDTGLRASENQIKWNSLLRCRDPRFCSRQTHHTVW